MSSESEAPSQKSSCQCSCSSCLFKLGVIFILLGIAAAVLAPIASWAPKLTIGWLFLIGGVMHGFFALRSRGAEGNIGHVVLALLMLAVASALLVAPLTGILSMPLLFALYFLAAGLIKTAVSFRMRDKEYWGYVFFNGILCFILAMLVFLQWPHLSAWVYGLLAGIDLAFGGWLKIMVALTKKGAPCKIES